MELVLSGFRESVSWKPDLTLTHSLDGVYLNGIGIVISDISSVCFVKHFHGKERITVYVNFFECGIKKSMHYYSGRMQGESICVSSQDENCQAVNRYIRNGCDKDNPFTECIYDIMQTAMKNILKVYGAKTT